MSSVLSKVCKQSALFHKSKLQSPLGGWENSLLQAAITLAKTVPLSAVAPGVTWSQSWKMKKKHKEQEHATKIFMLSSTALQLVKHYFTTGTLQ